MTDAQYWLLLGWMLLGFSDCAILEKNRKRYGVLAILCWLIAIVYFIAQVAVENAQ